MLLLAIFLMGLASAIYIGVDAGAGPRDSMMLAIKRTTGISIRAARAIIEVTVVTHWLVVGRSRRNWYSGLCPAGWSIGAMGI